MRPPCKKKCRSPQITSLKSEIPRTQTFSHVYEVKTEMKKDNIFQIFYLTFQTFQTRKYSNLNW